MTGLSVLYTSEAAEAQDWVAVPDRDRTGRLREVYWARRAELKSGRKRFVNATLYWRPNRTEIGRRGDEPGDGFVYLVSMAPRVEDRFEWLEVTEVFTTVPASRIEGAMRVLNEWREGRSALYEDAANASLENPVGASLWGMLSDGLNEAISKTAIPESEAPSMSLHVRVEARKKGSGAGDPTRNSSRLLVGSCASATSVPWDDGQARKRRWL